MPSNTIGEQYLDIFDALDLSDNKNRRIGVRVLEDFYGRIMTEVGRDLFPDEEPYHNRNLLEQWGNITGWLKTEDIEIHSEYGDTIGKIKSMREDVAHNYLSGVNRDRLEEIRGDAEPIREWLLDKGSKYHREAEKNSEVQAIEKRTEKTLNRILSAGGFTEQYLDERLNSIQSEAESLKSDLNQFSESSNRPDGGIPHELVNILHKSQKLDRKVWKLYNEQEEIDDLRSPDASVKFIK